MNGENAVRTCRSHVHGSLEGKEEENRKVGKIVEVGAKEVGEEKWGGEKRKSK